MNSRTHVSSSTISIRLEMVDLSIGGGEAVVLRLVLRRLCSEPPGLETRRRGPCVSGNATALCQSVRCLTWITTLPRGSDRKIAGPLPLAELIGDAIISRFTPDALCHLASARPAGATASGALQGRHPASPSSFAPDPFRLAPGGHDRRAMTTMATDVAEQTPRSGDKEEHLDG